MRSDDRRPGPLAAADGARRRRRRRCSQSSRARSALGTSAPAARRARAAAARGARRRRPGSRTAACSGPPLLALDALRRRRRGHGAAASTSRSPRWRSPPPSSPRPALPRRDGRQRPVARLRDADEAADHVAAARHRRGGMFVGAGACRRSVSSSRRWSASRSPAAAPARSTTCSTRDIDRLMGKRTERRPVAAGRVPPSRALEFGLVLSALSFVLLATTVNVLTAALALVGNLFYVLVYTRWLKRSTPQNIVIGGAAGAVPPLVGYAAASGNLALPALLALPDRLPLDAAALLGARAADQGELRGRRRADAAGRARRAGDDAADRALHARARRVHARRRALARAGLHRRRRSCSARVFLWLAWQLRRDTTPRRAAILFHYSLAYLALLFVAAAARIR